MEDYYPRINIDGKEGNCFIIEALVDALHAVLMVMDNSEYDIKSSDILSEHEAVLKERINRRYAAINRRQLFEPQFEGAFLTDFGSVDHIRVDATQHRICALMKLKQ